MKLRVLESFILACCTCLMLGNSTVAHAQLGETPSADADSVSDSSNKSGLRRFESTEVHMGVEVTIAAYCDQQDTAVSAIQAAFTEFAKVDSLFSNYKADSAINKLMNGYQQDSPVRLDEELWPLFFRSFEIAEVTDGGFDFTLGNLTELWREIRRSEKMPETDRLEAALNSSGFQKVSLNLDRYEINISNDKLRFDFGGIAKGYAADLALAALKKHGVDSAMVNASGDIALGDSPPNQEGWKIAVKDPFEKELSKYMVLKNCGVATSGDEVQFVEIEGIRYSHILDPKTGLGLEGKRSVTVIARNATDADAFASAFNVLPSSKTVEVLNRDLQLKVSLIVEQARTIDGHSLSETRTLKPETFPKLHKIESDNELKTNSKNR